MDATRTGSRYLASNYLDLAVPIEEKEEIQFGLPEIMLIALFVIGFVGRKRSFKFKKQIRWISMIAGMVVLGILFNRPINLVYINKFLLGFWPDWRIHLYWYLLIGGVILVFALRKKNIYCQWFCPLGAAQECIGAIGGAKNASFVKHHQYLEWLKRSIVWTAIMIAFIFRNPSLSNYEISGTLFTLTGSNIQFLLLAAVLFAALFIKRAWCVYLCPISSVEQFVSTLRVWGTESWKKIKV